MSLASGIYSLPPTILSQDLSQTYWPWSGYVAATTVNAPPTSPPTSDAPTFRATTNELDRYRVIALVIGIAIGVYVVNQ
jgi:hypothetical protein